MAMKSFNFAFIFLMTITPMVLSIRKDFPVLKSVEEIEAEFGAVSSLTDCLPHNDPPECKLTDKIRRRIDGSCNNLDNRKFGAANTPLLTPVGKRYFDLAGLDIPPNHVALQEFSLIPSADSVSRQLFSGVNTDDEDAQVSLMFMTFGQFLDHDLSLTPYSEKRVQTNCKEIDDFVFPRYPMFDVASFGTTCRSFFRSFAVCQDPQKPRTVRDHPTTITAFIDASNVYGSSEKLLEELRDPADPKLLKVTKVNANPLEDLLPIINSAACLNNKCFEAGDERASENIALTAMHTIFVREHNRIARRLKKIHFDDVTWNDNVIFFTAKRIVGMLMQKIVYKEWLPELVTLSAYKGYNSKINPGIIDGFSTAAYRFGHSLVRNNWPRRDGNLKETVFPRNIPLRNTFLNITELTTNGIEEIVFGFLREAANDFDQNFANGIFRQLFNNVEETNSFFSNFRQSLITRNIHRGRDHGLRDYLTWRNRYPELKDGFGDIKLSKVHELLRVYRNQRDNVDLFVGGILETKRPGSLVGPTFEAIIKEQFTNLRDGDRFYYENSYLFKPTEINEINKDSMSRVLCDNLQGLKVAPKKPFRFNSADSSFIDCSRANFPAANLKVFERLDFV